jgi:hypothetical protein
MAEAGQQPKSEYRKSRGFQAKQSSQFSSYITLQIRGQLAQIPAEQERFYPWSWKGLPSVVL